MIVTVCGLLLCLLISAGQLEAAQRGKGKQVPIRNEQMEVILDPLFPRVLEYHVPGRPKLLGAIPEARPTVELNGTVYTPAEFTVALRAEAAAATYEIAFPKLGLLLELVFRLQGRELLMKLTGVEENGGFRLRTLYFPNHVLLRMSALTPDSMMYRGEHPRNAWKDRVYRGGYWRSVPRFGRIAEEDGEAHPMRANWAAMYAPGLCATMVNNIAYWRLASQFLGYDGAASDFALWNGVYHYRLRNELQPYLETRIAILTKDENGDERVDWMEAALWHRQFFRRPNPLYAGPTYVYKIINAWTPHSGSKPVTTFEECLPIIKAIAELSGGLPQIVYLVGWQYEGHDTGYPSLDKVNPQLGGREKLFWLAREAKKYNATISYHINLDDAVREHPGWDPSFLCLGRNGKPYPWMFQGGKQAYHISHTREIETGYFERRARAFLETVPLAKSLHLDTFRYINISFGPGDYIGMNEELELGCKRIFKWFASKGIDITSEGPSDGFYGTLSWFLHRSAIRDPFHWIMMHGRAYGGGKPREEMVHAPGGKPVAIGEVLGWSINRSYQARPHSPRRGRPRGRVFSVSEASDMYYLGTLLQYYLEKKELLYLGPQSDEYVARFADSCISRRLKDGSLLVRDGDVVIARGQDRFIPLNSSEIRLYSVTGGERDWRLPAGWSGAQTELIELGENSAPPKRVQTQGNWFGLNMEPRRPYALRKR